MKKYLYQIFVAVLAIASFTFASCSDDEDGSGSGDVGALIVNGESWKCEPTQYNGGEDPSITGNYTGGVYEVSEAVSTIRLQKCLFKPGDESLMDRTMLMQLMFNRFYLEETSKGTDITSYLTNAYIDRAEPYLNGPSWQGVVENGTITFEGLTDNDHYINIRFNNVTLKMTDKKGRYYDKIYTIDGTVRYARDDYWGRPAFPVFELTLDSQETEGSVNGIWEIEQSPYVDRVIKSEFQFKPSYDVLAIDIVKTISDDEINAQLDRYVGKNIAEDSAVSFGFGRYGDSDIEYVSGSITIEKYKKLGYLFMYPDITFVFNNFTFKQDKETHTINGRARVVYHYTKY